MTFGCGQCIVSLKSRCGFIAQHHMALCYVNSGTVCLYKLTVVNAWTVSFCGSNVLTEYTECGILDLAYGVNCAALGTCDACSLVSLGIRVREQTCLIRCRKTVTVNFQIIKINLFVNFYIVLYNNKTKRPWMSRTFFRIFSNYLNL